MYILAGGSNVSEFICGQVVLTEPGSGYGLESQVSQAHS